MRRILAVIAATAILVGGGTYFATAETTPDPVNACVTKSTGAVRIVATTTLCKSSEARLSWNLSGPQGLPGTNGTDGVSGYEVVEHSEDFTTGFPGVTKIALIDGQCPAGKTVLSGTGSGSFASGGAITGPAAVVESQVYDSDDDDVMDSFQAGFAHLDGSAFTDTETLHASLQVICATMN